MSESGSGRRSPLVFGTITIAGIISLVLSIVLSGAPAAGSQGTNNAPATETHVCGPANPGSARCHLIRIEPDRGRPTPTTTTSTTTTTTTSTTTGPPPACAFSSAPPSGVVSPGFGPCDLQSAYNLLSASPSLGSGTTIAIVDAFDDPNAESDLATYRQQYALPPCPSSNGCFQKLNQTGGTLVYPAPNPSWAQEIALDLDMASAICPNCHLRLIEANSNLTSDLYAAEDTAVNSGAHIVSNSWGGGEYSGEAADDVHFNRAGVAITVSSGDSGFGVQYPAASQYVTAVGGTSLNRAGNARGWSETAWSGAGSGCSADEPQPSWQAALNLPGCGGRMVADVSAEADPHTPVEAYVTFGSTGWTKFGGTSVASPIVAGVYALAGNAGSVTYGSYPYSHTGALYDVTGGSNGSCSPAYLCTGGSGYDGPTGLGTPDGTGAF